MLAFANDPVLQAEVKSASLVDCCSPVCSDGPYSGSRRARSLPHRCFLLWRRRSGPLDDAMGAIINPATDRVREFLSKIMVH